MRADASRDYKSAMEVKFDLARDDIWNAQWQLMKSMPGLRWTFYYLFPLFVYGILAYVFSRDVGIEVGCVLALPITAVALWGGVCFARAIVTRIPKEGRGVLGEHVVSVSDAAIAESTSVNESKFAWSAVSSVRREGGYILIMIDGLMMLPIPERSFINVNACQEFYERALEYWEVSRDAAANQQNAAN